MKPSNVSKMTKDGSVPAWKTTPGGDRILYPCYELYNEEGHYQGGKLEEVDDDGNSSWTLEMDDEDRVKYGRCIR